MTEEQIKNFQERISLAEEISKIQSDINERITRYFRGKLTPSLFQSNSEIDIQTLIISIERYNQLKRDAEYNCKKCNNKRWIPFLSLRGGHSIAGYEGCPHCNSDGKIPEQKECE